MTYLASPKSATNISSSLIRMFSGFKSLWMIFYSWRAFIPNKICLNLSKASTSWSLLFKELFNKSLRLPPSQNGRIKKTDSSVFNNSSKESKNGFIIFVNIFISVANNLFPRSPNLSNFLNRTSFAAYIFFVSLFSALKTSPNAPLPIFSIKMYYSKILYS